MLASPPPPVLAMMMMMMNSKITKTTDPMMRLSCDPVVAFQFIIVYKIGEVTGFNGTEQTIKQKLPEGFQRSEFLLDHGMVDRIVHRSEMKEEISTILKNFGFGA